MLYTIFDIETNGLIRNGKFPCPLEVACIQVNKKLEIVRHETLYFYREGWEVENDAQKIHGLTTEFLEQYKDKYYENFVKLFTYLQYGNLVTKNGTNFDVRVINDFFMHGAPGFYGLFPNRHDDMQPLWKYKFQEWFAKTYGMSTNRIGTLEELITMLGYTEDQVRELFLEQFPEEEGRARAHGALYDSFMTYLLFKKSVEDKMIKL